MNLTLADFDKSKRDLTKYTFTSEFVRFLEVGFDEEFESKEKLSIRRKTKGKGKESKLVIVVGQEWASKDENGIAEFVGGEEVEFGTEEEAIEFFISEIREAEFLIEKNKENILWDGRRYFWKTENGKMKRVIV